MSRPRLFAALLAFLFLAACDGATEPGERAQEKVVFLRYIDPAQTAAGDSLEIYSVNADGTGLRNLTNHPAEYAGVSASPDGRRVAFRSDRGARWFYHIWLMNSDGSGLTQLTTEHSNIPRWSPDGTRIAFEMVGSDDLVHVYVINADGTNQTKVSGPAMQVGDTCSTSTTKSHIELVGWMGNGRIAFARYYCGLGYRYFLVNPDGTGFTQTDIRLWDTHFSPDGSQVLVTRSEGGSSQVILMNADGTGARVLSTQGARQGLPQKERYGGGYSPWSPDGKRIVFFARTSATPPMEPQTCIDGALPYVVNVDGSGLQRLMDSCTYGTFSGWSPSGEQIAFNLWAALPGAPDVHVVNADGTGSVNLTNSPFRETEVTWIPRD